MNGELEFIVVEGPARGESFPLRGEQIEMGRRDPYDRGGDAPGRLSFPEPTVSGVHAILSWDGRRNRYLLTHRSATNHTLVNGKVVSGQQFIHVGDRVKMGNLLIQSRLTPGAAAAQAAAAAAAAAAPAAPPRAPEPKPLQSTPHLLIVNGPDAGKLHPLLQETLVLQEPNSHQTYEPTLNIPGAGTTRCLLLSKGGDVHVTCAESGGRPVLIDQPMDGVVRQRHPGPEFGNLLGPQSLLLVGKVAVVLVSAEEAETRRSQLLAGEQASPLQAGLFHEGERLWNRGELHSLRFTAGPLKGTQFWLDHRQMHGAISFGRIGQKTLVELTDRGAVACEIVYKDDSVRVTNVDPELALPLNGEDVAPGQSQELKSGDTLRLGRTVIRYEYLPVQQRINTYSLFQGSQEIPLRRSVTVIGSGPNCDVQIADDRLNPLVGRLVITETTLRYQHRQPGMAAIVGNNEVLAGQDAAVKLDSVIHLGPVAELRLGRRQMSDDQLES